MGYSPILNYGSNIRNDDDCALFNTAKTPDVKTVMYHSKNSLLFCISQLQLHESRTRNEDDVNIYIVGIPSVKRFLNAEF